MEKEVWKFIDGYDGLYAISNFGKVKNIKTGKELATQYDGRYKTLQLSKNGIHKKNYIHRLIAVAFIPNESGKKCINHIDGNKTNNNISNLEWVTHSENNKHAMKTGLNKAPKGSNQNFSKLTNENVLEICKMLDDGESPANICDYYNVSNRTIYDIKLGNTWSWLTKRGVNIEREGDKSN